MNVGSTIARGGGGATRQEIGPKIAVIYEDREAGLRARQVFERVALRLSFDATFRLSFWRFELFSEHECFKAAAQEAETADIVFLAGQGRRDLPARLRLWLLGWLASREGAPSALVLSFETTAWRLPAMIEALDVLKAYASLAGVEVFLQQCEASGSEVAFASRSSQGTGPALSPRPFNERSHPHWGINE